MARPSSYSHLSAAWLPAAICLVLVFAGWRAFGIGMADWWSRQNPEAAMQWRPDHAEAALKAAEVAVYADPKSEAVARWSRAAISAYPLDGRGYRVLADAAGTAPNLGKVLHEIAAERSPRDYMSQAWVINEALRTSDYSRAMAMLDRLLRTRPEIAHHLNPTLVSLASTPEAQPALAATLARDPPWREARFATIIGAASSGLALSPLMSALRSTPRGVSAGEQAAWINRLVADRQYGVAYLAWIESLSPEQQQYVGNIHDGGFEQVPSGSPFEWQLQDVAGAQIARARVEGGSGAESLRIVFDERSREFAHVTQVLLLAPGSYRLSGRERMLGIDERAGMNWAISCAENGQPLAQSTGFSGNHDWQAFSADFEVPAPGCEAQRIVLRRTAADPSAVSGAAMFDDLSIERR
ncbi:hypothetical protein [Arenimonas sp.]|uniref:hypothetical protein n=1 Tax=Arenimonas sp. TaxID=1872635 RepID=UPI0039E5B31D